MAKASGANRGTNKGAYKNYNNEDGDGAMASNERELRASVGRTTNVSKPGSHSTVPPGDMPSKAMQKGKVYEP